MKNQTLYLNNSGHRWVQFDREGNKEKITLKTESGQDVTRTVQYYSAFGNFATARISYKGKKMDVFPDSILSDTEPKTGYFSIEKDGEKFRTYSNG